jgi:hypothetical protein
MSWIRDGVLSFNTGARLEQYPKTQKKNCLYQNGWINNVLFQTYTGWTTSTIPFSLISSLFGIDFVFSNNAKFLRTLPQLVFRKMDSFLSQTSQPPNSPKGRIYLPIFNQNCSRDNKENVDHYSQTVVYRKQLCCNKTL